MLKKESFKVRQQLLQWMLIAPSIRGENNSVFKYYSHTSGRILVFVFLFGWLFETKYYSFSYSGYFLILSFIRIRIVVIFQTKYYLFLYSGDFLKPNVIHIRNFSNQIPLGFLFEHYIYFSEHCYFGWAKKCWRCQNLCQKSESKGKHDV